MSSNSSYLHRANLMLWLLISGSIGISNSKSWSSSLIAIPDLGLWSVNNNPIYQDSGWHLQDSGTLVIRAKLSRKAQQLHGVKFPRVCEPSCPSSLSAPSTFLWPFPPTLLTPHTFATTYTLINTFKTILHPYLALIKKIPLRKVFLYTGSSPWGQDERGKKWQMFAVLVNALRHYGDEGIIKVYVEENRKGTSHVTSEAQLV